MIYDFNIPYPNTSDASDLVRIEKILSRIQSCKYFVILLFSLCKISIIFFLVDSHSIVALNLSTDTLMNVKKVKKKKKRPLDSYFIQY